MARPRRFTDQQLIIAAAEAVVARNDGVWSLADVARATGMSPAALVKRFGSKAGLLHAMTESWVASIPAYSAPAVTDPKEEIRGWVHKWASTAGDPATVRGHLTLLFEEIAHSATRELLHRGRGRQADFIRAALADARSRGLLNVEPPTDTAEIWIDLLAGAAVRGAIAEPQTAFARVVRHITGQLEDWSKP